MRSKFEIRPFNVRHPVAVFPTIELAVKAIRDGGFSDDWHMFEVTPFFGRRMDYGTIADIRKRIEEYEDWDNG